VPVTLRFFLFHTESVKRDFSGRDRHRGLQQRGSYQNLTILRLPLSIVIEDGFRGWNEMKHENRPLVSLLLPREQPQKVGGAEEGG
jgi:hypothetical protein